MDGCGRPVSVRCVDACRQAFSRYPIETQQRIVDDATIRSQGKKWDDPAFIPDPLKYLQSEVWDIAPITARKFPAPTKKSKGEDAMDRVMARAIARDREEGPLR